MIYPWHAAAWQQLTEHWQQQSHALLICGQANTGKTAFARYLAQALLCEQPNAHTACGRCPSCHLFVSGNHPDFYTLSPEENDDNTRKLPLIKIDAVRALLEPLHQSSVRSGRRVVLISPAESLNTQAANALLKILEEPPEAVMFLLVSHQRDRVLPTIKSRCRQWLLPSPTQNEALNYLQQQHSPEHAHALLAFHSGAPLFEHQPELDDTRQQLLTLLSAPRLLAILDYAAEFDKNKHPLALLLDWLNKWLVDVALAQHQLPPLYYPNHAQASAKIATQTNPATLFRYQQTLNQLAPYGYHSLNVRMQTESVLSQYLMLLHNKSRSTVSTKG